MNQNAVDASIRVQRHRWGHDLEVAIFGGFRNVEDVAQSIVMTKQKTGTIVEPVAYLSPQEGQVLMDDLWHAGLRPSEGSGSAGSLAATERHLADMRKLVGHQLKVTL